MLEMIQVFSVKRFLGNLHILGGKRILLIFFLKWEFNMQSVAGVIQYFCKESLVYFSSLHRIF